jgi:hypothetical protein
MTTEGHRYAIRKNSELWSQEDMDEELTDIKKEIEKLALHMQKKAKPRWVYEWPMRKAKEKWPVKELMARRHHRLLKRCLRHTENLNGPRELVQICEPETGRDLSEMGSVEDLKNCQEGREEIPVC